MNEINLGEFEGNLNEEIGKSTIGKLVMETEGAKDFYKGEGGSRKKIAEQFPYPELKKRTTINGAFFSSGGYRTKVKNLIKKHGGNPDLWEPKAPSGMEHKTATILVNNEGEELLRAFIYTESKNNVDVKYKLSDKSFADKKDKRFAKWAKGPKKEWVPKWITEIGITDEQDLAEFYEEFKKIQTIAVKKKNIVELKSGDFSFSRE